jgi:predicted RNase H-like HicB family nuclease
MILDIIVNKTDDGFTAEIPSLKGCEAWAHDEDTVMDKIIDLAAYYLKIDSREKFKVDRARTSKNKIIYKLVFNKSIL